MSALVTSAFSSSVAESAAPPIVPVPVHAAPVLGPKRALRSDKPRLNAGSSSLAAEVSALDSARTAISIGAEGEALRLIADYQRDFPAGELRVEADVVALEALAARGDRAALAKQAARFFARYPNDPHTASVRRLLE